VSRADGGSESSPFRFAVGPHSREGSALSSQAESDGARRLPSLALMVAVISGMMLLVEELTGPPSALRPWVRLGLASLTVGLSIAIHAVLRGARLGTRPALALGLGYQTALGLLFSIAFHAIILGSGMEVRGWSPTAVWALIYPLVVPGRTRRVVFATLATALMDPLGLFLSVSLGAPMPSTWVAAQMFTPTAMACVIAPVGARIVYDLTVEVKRVRDMGSYRLVEKIGEGGMGEVWRAEHRMLARGAAIKLIRPAALGVGEADRARETVKRFQREAQATAGLRSPHTIELYDYGVAADGTFHYVMELLEGFSFQGLVERFGPVPPARAVRLLRQACHSLAEAHAAGLVHRDVKPANLFVCRLGLDVDFVKVLDFGLVKAREGASEGATALTMEGTFTGTPAFMPPEVALGERPVDGRADLYALGCVAYWLLTGHRVFGGGTAMQMVIDHIRLRPTPPSQRTAQAIPEALERIVLRCLEKDPDARPASAAVLSHELGSLGLEGHWSDDQAREWWRSHAPASTGRATTAPTSSVEETRSVAPRVSRARLSERSREESP
jgi:eukaryotic-like serine/threonine-protein kinase